MEPTGPWRALCRTEDADRARTIVTTIAAMEFPVRLLDAMTGEVIEKREDIGEGPFVIETHDAHRSDLAGVLEDILDEQDEFDEQLERRDRFVRRVRRIAIVVLIVIVTILAVFRIISL